MDDISFIIASHRDNHSQQGSQLPELESAMPRIRSFVAGNNAEGSRMLVFIREAGCIVEPRDQSGWRVAGDVLYHQSVDAGRKSF
jgi:hypothetical protein